MKSTWLCKRPSMLWLVLVLGFVSMVAAAPASAGTPEDMHLKALRIARLHFPGRTGAGRVILTDVPATEVSENVVAYRVLGDKIPADTYVVFERSGSGWKALGISNSPEPHPAQVTKHRAGRRR